MSFRGFFIFVDLDNTRGDFKNKKSLSHSPMIGSIFASRQSWMLFVQIAVRNRSISCVKKCTGTKSRPIA